jgi:hypothetical protein
MSRIKQILKEEVLKEAYSGVEGYLQALAQMTGEKQRIYYTWILNNMKKVNVVNHKENRVLAFHVKEMLRTTPSSMICQKKGCYETAFRTALNRNINVEYVEGYVQSLIPIVHAWNYYPDENIYFDLTNDIAWDGEDSHFNEYYEVKRFRGYELSQWSSITGYAGGFLESPQFMREIIQTNGELYGRDEWDYDDDHEY